jgi:hypothetical protein
MGNHEFCVRCEQSDFHQGQTCEEAYPEQLKRVQDRQLPSAESIRTLLTGKQYFDNDYSPADFLRCACKRSDCQKCQPPASVDSGNCIA